MNEAIETINRVIEQQIEFRKSAPDDRASFVAGVHDGLIKAKKILQPEIERLEKRIMELEQKKSS